MEPMDFVYGLVSGLLSGVIVGYIVEHYRLKNELKVERIKRLTPHVEIVHPIIEELCDDVIYFQKAQMRKGYSEDPSFIKKIGIAFDKYETWYIQFQSDGLKPELSATRKQLFNLLNGLFVHSRMSRKYGQDYVLREINEISTSAKDCLSELEQFLSS